MAVRRTGSGMQSVGTPAQQAGRTPRPRLRGGGGGRPSPTPSPAPKTVGIEGNVVTIDGQSFSVRPGLQSQFIRERTGGAGISAQEAIEKAESSAKSIEAEAAIQRTQQALRERAAQRTVRDLSPTEEARFEQNGRGGKDRGTIQPAPKRSFIQRVLDLPAQQFERATGRTPREAAASLGIGGPDTSQPLTALDVAADISRLPIVAGVEVPGILAGAAARRGAEFVPEGFGQRTVTITEPQFGTVTTDAPRGITERQVDIDIFTPEGVETTVRTGTSLGLFLAAPAAVVAPGLVFGGTRTALDEEATTRERAMGAAEAGLGGFLAGSAITRVARTPVTIEKATQQLSKPLTLEVQAQKVIEGKPETISTFFRLTQTKPSRTVIQTTRGRQFFGLQPLSVTAKEGQFVVQTTPIPVKKGDIFLVSEQVSGKQTVKFSKVAQVSKKTSTIDGKSVINIKGEKIPEEKLKDVEAFLRKQLSKNGEIRLLNQDTQEITTLGISKAVKKIKTTPRTLTEKPIINGRVDRSATVSEVERLGEVTGADIFGFRTSSRPIRTSSPRPTAITQEGEGLLFRLTGERAVEEAVGATRFRTDSRGLLRETLEEPALISTLVQAPRIQPPTPTIITTSPKAVSDFEKAVFGTTAIATTSPFLTTAPQVSQRVDTITSPTITGDIFQLTGQQQDISQAQRQGVSQVPTSDTAAQQDIFQGTISEVSTDTLTAQQQGQTQRAASLQRQAQQQEKLSRGLLDTAQRPSPTPTRTPVRTNLLGTSDIGQPSRTPFLDILRDQGYLSQVKQKGKWVNVDKESRLKPQAEKLAKFAADKSIAASARVKPSSKTPIRDALNIMVNNNKFRDFRKSKGQRIPLENTWIEKRKHRLDTPKEVQTLQQFKRSKQFKDIFGGSSGGGSSLNLFGSSSRRKPRRSKFLFSS